MFLRQLMFSIPLLCWDWEYDAIRVRSLRDRSGVLFFVDFKVFGAWLALECGCNFNVFNNIVDLGATHTKLCIYSRPIFACTCYRAWNDANPVNCSTSTGRWSYRGCESHPDATCDNLHKITFVNLFPFSGLILTRIQIWSITHPSSVSVVLVIVLNADLHFRPHFRPHFLRHRRCLFQ